MQERPYQATLEAEVEGAWAAGYRNVLMRLDTGGGKTFILSRLHARHPGASCVIAHRQELVGQLSLALASQGLRHSLIAAKDTKRGIMAEHMAEFGRSFYDPGARAAVASVDTLIRAKDLGGWAGQVTRWTCDEGHHLVEDNKWHTAIGMFTHPACQGLLTTATPQRADGKGLGRHADGVADIMVQGPPMRWLIEDGWLTDYRVVCPESDMQLLEADIGASGDWSPTKLRAAAKASHIVGDVVASYQKWAAGKLGVTFCPDVETATEICAAYNAAGVPAGLLTGDTESGFRRHMLRQFKARQLLQIVAVDIISEGFDLPAMEVISLARKTASLAVYMQQFGRALRPMFAPGFDLDTQAGRLASIAASVKPKALVIDHVGNFVRHGPPDRGREWTLDSRDRKSAPGLGIPMRVCLSCKQPFERTLSACKWCQAEIPEPTGRSSPEMVDGALAELDAETLARLRGEVAVVDMTAHEYGHRLAATGLHQIGIMANVKRHAAKQEAQATLRDMMARWGGPRHAAGHDDARIQREFWFTFGIDVLSAQALGASDAASLQQRIEATLAQAYSRPNMGA